MSKLQFVGILSAAVGFVLFVNSSWALKIIMENQANQSENRITILSWATAAALGTSAGLFQCIFSLCYTCQIYFYGATNSRNWTLVYFILHVIFLIFVLVSLFTALVRNMFNVSGVSATLFVVIELLSICNFVACLVLVEKETEFIRKGIFSHFTLDYAKELRQNWESYLSRRRSPGSGHSRIL